MDTERSIFREMSRLIVVLSLNYLWIIKTMNKFKDVIGDTNKYYITVLIISICIISLKIYDLLKTSKITNLRINKICWGGKTLLWIILLQIERYLAAITQNLIPDIILIIVSLIFEISVVSFMIIDKYYCIDNNEKTNIKGCKEDKEVSTEIQTTYFEIEDLYIEDRPVTWIDRVMEVLLVCVVFGGVILFTIIGAASNKPSIIINSIKLRFYLLVYIASIILEIKLIRSIVEYIKHKTDKNN